MISHLELTVVPNMICFGSSGLYSFKACSQAVSLSAALPDEWGTDTATARVGGNFALLMPAAGSVNSATGKVMNRDRNTAGSGKGS